MERPHRALAAPGAARPAFPGGNGVVAFTTDSGGGRSLAAVDADGGGAHALVDPRRVHDPLGSSWSADGARLALEGRVNGRFQVFRSHADGTRLRRLTRRPGFSGAPAWTPDGRRIVFASTRSGGEAHLWLVPAVGGRPRRLTDTAAPVDEFSPALQPLQR